MIEKFDKAIGELLDMIVQGDYSKTDVDTLAALVKARGDVVAQENRPSVEPKVYGPLQEPYKPHKWVQPSPAWFDINWVTPISPTCDEIRAAYSNEYEGVK
jgi:hypothetical protein